MGMLSGLYYRTMALAGIPRWMRSCRNAAPVLCYHNVVSDGAPPVGDEGLHMAASRFERQMRWLGEHYDVIGLDALLDRLETGAALRGTAAVTFDDAYEGVFRHAVPILRALHLPATVFVVANAAESRQAYWWDLVRCPDEPTRDHWLSALRGDRAAILARGSLTPHPNLPGSHLPAGWDTLAAARDAWLTIGVHSASHRCLTAVGPHELENELKASRTVIAHRLGVVPTCFAYPYGRWSGPVREAVRAAGYRGAFTLDGGLVRRREDALAIRRINVPAGIDDAPFQAWVAGLRPGSGSRR